MPDIKHFSIFRFLGSKNKQKKGFKLSVKCRLHLVNSRNYP